MPYGMRAFALLFIILLLGSGLGEVAASIETEKACVSSPLGLGPEAGQLEPGIYRLYYDGWDHLAELARSFDIWEVDPKAGSAVLALATSDAARLKARGYRLEPAEELAQRWRLGPPGYECYRDVDELYTDLHEMATSHPTLTELLDYGDSWRKGQGLAGYDLWVLKLTNHQVQAPKPRFFLMANIHGRELTTPETAMYFAQYLLDNHGTDPDATWILDYHEIYIVVTANPDGRQLVEDSCYQRKNRNETLGACVRCDPWGIDQFGVDLNRNNPFHWGGAGDTPCGLTYQGTSAASEPETYYLNDLVRSLFPDQRPDDDGTPAPQDTTGLLISLHSYGDLVLWPWGWTSTGAPNETSLRTLGRKFAYWNDYGPEQASDLYPTTGDTTDWAYGELGIPAYTFELGEFFYQSCSDLQQIMEENLGALLYAAKVPGAPYSAPAGPDALGLSVLPAELAPGHPVELEATIDDTRYSQANGLEPAQNITAAAYYVDTPPWIATTAPITYSMAAVDGNFGEVVEKVEATIDTTGLSSGQHIIFVRGQDADGQWGALSAVFFHIAEPPSFYIHLPLVIRDR
ncbi:M14 family zinc carboxypeptidase [Chloroflexota bacterium]